MTKKNTPPRYIHRDLSWLAFNKRVLDEVTDLSNPLFERLRFLAIFFNNLDEFIMVRFARCMRMIDAGYHNKDRYGWYPYSLAAAIVRNTRELSDNAYSIYRKKCLRDLKKNNIHIKRPEELSPRQTRFARDYFEQTIFPVITPIAIDQGRPFPRMPSKTIVIGARLKRRKEEHLCLLIIPQNLQRLLRVPAEADEHVFCLLDNIILANLNRFFKGYTILDAALFRIIRDSELYLEEEGDQNLLAIISKEVTKRACAQVVYLSASKGCSPELLRVFSEHFSFPLSEVVTVEGDLDLTYLFELIERVPKAEHFYRTYAPAEPVYENIFDRIKESDMLLHLPYQSFKVTNDLISAAATDDSVLAIKMTLYRVNENSTIINALKKAATRNKQVTVLVELKARFDEEKNIQWVKELEDAGCHVIYGLKHMKVHSKITLIVRQEEGRINRYVHLSTGNYNEKTAKIYTDLGFFTNNEDFGTDISDVFNVITGYSVPCRWKHVVSAPHDLRHYFMECIDIEIENQKKNKSGFIFAKMNSLEDVGLIDKLYEASRAGVKIKLLVRGICSLIPGVAGMSETIEVRSIVGRFLEHTRVYLFNNNSTQRIFLSSADWMQRNLDRRIELLFEIRNEDLLEHLLFILNTYWKDTHNARVLLSDGSYVGFDKKSDPFDAQSHLLAYYQQK
jgi:polyphosphate kinase